MSWNSTINVSYNVQDDETVDNINGTTSPPSRPALAVPFFLGYILIIVPNIVGNSLVLTAIYRTKALQTFSYYLLANLAVSDIVVAFSATGEATFFMFLNTYARSELCSFIRGGLITKLCAAVSIFTLTMISIERYYGIVKPLMSQIWFRRIKLKYIVALIWLIATLFTIPIAYYLHMGFNDKCDFVTPKALWINIILLLLTVFGYIVPVTVATLGLFKIHKVLWGSLKIPGKSARKTITARKKVTRLLTTVLIVFIICTIPHFALATAGFLGFFELGHPAFRIAYLVLLAKSSMNPLIYCFNGSTFRRAIKKIFTRKMYIDPRSLYSSREREKTSKPTSKQCNSDMNRLAIICKTSQEETQIVYDTKL